MEKQQILLEIKYVYKIYYNVVMQLAMKYKVQDTIGKKFGLDSEEYRLMLKDIKEVVESLKHLKSILAIQLETEDESKIMKKIEEYIKTDPYCVLTEKFFEHDDFFNFEGSEEINWGKNEI